MSTTVNREYPYPGISEPPNGPLAFQQLAESVDADVQALESEVRAVKPFGHMGRSAGFQTLGAGATIAMEAAQKLKGGMTFDNTYDALVVPITGDYEVSYKAYVTTGAGFMHQCKPIKNGSLTPVLGPDVRIWKTDGTADLTGSCSDTISLVAGDKIALYASGGQTWGTTGHDGVYLEVKWVP